MYHCLLTEFQEHGLEVNGLVPLSISHFSFQEEASSLSHWISPAGYSEVPSSFHKAFRAFYYVEKITF